MPPAGTAATGTLPDQGRYKKILAGAIIVVILTATIFLILAKPGIGSPLPSSALPVTTQTTATPVVTSYVVVNTPSPEPTTIPTVPLLLTTTVPDTPRTSPTPEKATVCPSDRHACGANCTDLMKDPGNCGACGVSCVLSQTCQQGRCVTMCPEGKTNCFDGCYNLSYDAQNCGTCGNSCPFGLACNNSLCTQPLKTEIPTYAG